MDLSFTGKEKEKTNQVMNNEQVEELSFLFVTFSDNLTLITVSPS